MLDGIPFGSTGGIVGNRHRQGKGVRQLGLELGFPGMTAATVAAAGIGQNEQLAGTAIAGGTFLVPPMSNGMSGKGGGIVGNADHQSPAIFQNIVTRETKANLSPRLDRHLQTRYHMNNLYCNNFHLTVTCHVTCDKSMLLTLKKRGH